MSTLYKNFGEFICIKRKEKHISLREMAVKLSISAPYLSDVENGRRNSFNIDKLNAILNILELSECDKNLMFDLAGEKKKEIAPDLQDYINERKYVRDTLRIARDKDVDESVWNEFADKLGSKEKK